MDRKEILLKLQEIFREVTDEEEVVINYDTVADDVEGWDSLTHVQLVVAIEKYFKIKFTSLEVLSWKKVEDMVNSILAKVN